MIDLKRRTFLRGTLASGVIATAVGAGLLRPTTAMAAVKWHQDAFSATKVPAALKGLYGDANPTNSSKIKIKAPLQAEDGRYVRIDVKSQLPKTESISVLVEKNPQPLTSTVHLHGNAAGYYVTRVKMRKTSDIMAVVKAGGRLYMRKQNIKVTIGGCGG